MPRVLFVDDDRNLLDGLRRALRRPPGWELDFVDGGAEALKRMEAAPFDVVVSDMRMPGMNGADLLIAVKERWPQTVRFILSGYSEAEAVMRTVPVAHRFLTKPCEAARVKEAVERALAVETLLSEPRLREAVGTLSSLPPVPAAYREITRELANPDVTVADIARIVETDTAMSLKLLQLVNSAFFGLPQELADVEQATAYLGLETIRDLVLSLEIFRPPPDSAADTERLLERIQSEATQVAMLARRLCPDSKLGRMSFTAGLLHDVGAVVLATGFPKEFVSACAEAASSKRPLWSVEREHWGAHHGEVGACLLGLWGLPHAVIETAAYHHEPRALAQESPSPLTYVHAALALLAVEDNAVFPEPCELDAEYIGKLGLTERIPEWKNIVVEQAGAAA
jgi:HD-like signal output (HDOD) protein/AmiR/NasT family two-component response regulator